MSAPRRVAACAALAAAALLGSAPGAAEEPEVPPFGLGDFDRSEPISIRADRLEAREGTTRRTLAFRREVRVRQGGLTLRADTLEAVYAAGSREPETLWARGDVRIQEGTRSARCLEAHYDRAAQSLVCRGEPAELWDGADRLSGREVAFDLARHRVEVRGGSELEIRGRWLRALEGEAPGDPEAPLSIRSSELEASEEDGERRIRFLGDAVASRGGLELSAGELEVRYPRESPRPDRLLARQDVVVRDGSREARCARAEYRPGPRTLACEGQARLEWRE